MLKKRGGKKGRQNEGRKKGEYQKKKWNNIKKHNNYMKPYFHVVVFDVDSYANNRTENISKHKRTQKSTKSQTHTTNKTHSFVLFIGREHVSYFMVLEFP